MPRTREEEVAIQPIWLIHPVKYQGGAGLFHGKLHIFIKSLSLPLPWSRYWRTKKLCLPRAPLTLCLQVSASPLQVDDIITVAVWMCWSPTELWEQLGVREDRWMFQAWTVLCVWINLYIYFTWSFVSLARHLVKQIRLIILSGIGLVRVWFYFYGVCVCQSLPHKDDNPQPTCLCSSLTQWLPVLW